MSTRNQEAKGKKTRCEQMFQEEGKDGTSLREWDFRIGSTADLDLVINGGDLGSGRKGNQECFTDSPHTPDVGSSVRPSGLFCWSPGGVKGKLGGKRG